MTTTKNTVKINGDWVADITVNGKDAYRLRKNKKKLLINEILHYKTITNGKFDLKIWKFYQNGEHLGGRVAIDFFDLAKEEQREILEIYLFDGYVGGFFDDYTLTIAA